MLLLLYNNNYSYHISCSNIQYKLTLNLLDLLNGPVQLQSLEISIINFADIKTGNLLLVSQQYRAWSDWTYEQACLALYW